MFCNCWVLMTGVHSVVILSAICGLLMLWWMPMVTTDPHTVTTTDRTTNMRYMHTTIVSMHLATRGNNKLLRTPYFTFVIVPENLL